MHHMKIHYSSHYLACDALTLLINQRKKMKEVDGREIEKWKREERKEER